jgi:hypothetical protein
VRRSALAIVAVVTGLALGGCASPHGTQTLQHEPDLVRISDQFVPPGLRGAITSEVRVVRTECRAVKSTVEALEPGVQLEVNDEQCEWVPSATPDGAPRIVMGIIDGGHYRFDETAKLLHDDRRIDGVGAPARFETPMRFLTTLRAGRFWYIQLVGDPASGTDALRIARTIARALVAAPVTPG